MICLHSICKDQFKFPVLLVQDAIIGKCNVLCDSDDQRNPRPSRNELRNANYVFSRTFDTKLQVISEHFPDAIAGIGGLLVKGKLQSFIVQPLMLFEYGSDEANFIFYWF